MADQRVRVSVKVVDPDNDANEAGVTAAGELKVLDSGVEKVYTREETALTWRASGGDELITLTSLAPGAGRNGAMHDFGTSARSFRFRWLAFLKLTGTPTVGTTVDVYLKTGDGTHFDNDDGTGDVLLSSVNKLRNLHFLGAIVVDEAAVVDQVATGVVDIYARQAAPVFFNQSGLSLSATAGDNGFNLVPVPVEVQ